MQKFLSFYVQAPKNKERRLLEEILERSVKLDLFAIGSKIFKDFQKDYPENAQKFQHNNLLKIIKLHFFSGNWNQAKAF